jgi:hypothetical protein
MPHAGASKHTLFWRAAAAVVCSQATLATWHAPSQTLPTQAAILQGALWYAAHAAATASQVGRSDAVAAAAQCAWNAACPMLQSVLRARLHEPLAHVCGTLNAAAPPVDAWLHSRVAAARFACMLSAGCAPDTVRALNEWLQPPAHASHRAVWAQLMELLRVPGAMAPDAMKRLGMYSGADQAPRWVDRARGLPSMAEQQKALDLACRCACTTATACCYLHSSCRTPCCPM